jgi:hypothetical protein
MGRCSHVDGVLTAAKFWVRTIFPSFSSFPLCVEKVDAVVVKTIGTYDLRRLELRKEGEHLQGKDINKFNILLTISTL